MKKKTICKLLIAGFLVISLCIIITRSIEVTPAEQLEEVTETMPLSKTAFPVLLGDLEQLGQTKDSVIQAYVHFCVQEMSNPISIFRSLVAENIFLAEEKDHGLLIHQSAEVELLPEKFTATQHSYLMDTQCPEMICDFLTLSALVRDNVALEYGMLGAFDEGNFSQLHYSKQEKCYYTYAILPSPITSYVIAIYIHEPADTSKQISDVEFQLLKLYHRDPDSEDGRDQWLLSHSEGERQAAALIGALEKLLSGQTILDQITPKYDKSTGYNQYQLPDAYTLGNFHVTIKTEHYITTSAEQVDYAVMVNYHISK